MLALAPLAARAQEPDEAETGEEPGPMDEPPGPEEPAPAPLTPDGEQRRTVRGSSEPDVHESAAKKAQRQWDERAFPPGSGAAGDGHRDEPPRGKADLPPELTTEKVKPRPAAAVRPDLPWLAQLAVGDLPVTWDPRVIRYLEFYKDDPQGRSIMSAWLRDQNRFRGLILAALRRHGLPEDLIYLCMIESSYDPWEYSRTGASGLWQFMPAHGRVYGLTSDYWIDERNDPEKSTEAAMLAWKDLYDRFGDWDLAMAAYNAGYGAVLKAIAKYNTNNFWALLKLENGLPWGSSIYVPKALAAAIVGRNRTLFGYTELGEAKAWEFDRVSVDRSVSLSVIARAVGASTEDIKWLNPELRRGRTPANAKSYSVRIPRGKKEQFARQFPQLRADWDGYDAVVVRHGERFEDVAATYGLTVKKLRELNGVDDIAEVRGGTILVVPKIDPAAREKNRVAAMDDLYSGGDKNAVSGDPLVVAVPDKDRKLSNKKRVFYRVVAGDTLEEVAAALGVRVDDLRQWNGLSEHAALHARMVLAAFVPPDFDADRRRVALLDDARLMVVTAGSEEHLDIAEGKKGRKRVRIVCKKGDTMESVGRPHKLSKYDMARINRRSYSKDIEPGEELIVYVIVDKAKARAAGVMDKKKSSASKARPRGGGKKSK